MGGTDGVSKGMSEAETIARCQQGDKGAFVELVGGHRDGAYRYCLGMVGSSEDALDIVQEAFLAAFQGIGRLDPARGFVGWFYGILRHLCLSTLRQRRPPSSPQILDGLSAPGPSPEAVAVGHEQQNALVSCLDELTPTQREVIVLREFEGHSYRDISEKLDVPIGTVMSRLYDARRALFRLMRRDPSFDTETKP